MDLQVKSDPAIRLAVHSLANQIPELAQRYFQGQRFDIYGEGPPAQATYKRGEFQTCRSKLDDESEIKDTKHAKEVLKSELRKKGLPKADILQAVGQFEAADENKMVECVPGELSMIKWATDAMVPDLSGQATEPLFLAKIVYEMLALGLASTIFDPALEQLRESLRACSGNDGFQFKQGLFLPYKPCHGIAVTCRTPASVRIMLFGALHYEVKLPNIYYGGECVSYYHNLLDGNEKWTAIKPMSCFDERLQSIDQ